MNLPLALAIASVAATSSHPAPPVAKAVHRITPLNGVTLVDDYYWLRDKDGPDVRAYLEAENAFTAAGMKHTEALQERLYQELLGRIKETDTKVPVYDGGYWYYTRTEEGKSYPYYCRKRGTLASNEEVILDQNALAAGHRFHDVDELAISPDGMKLAYLEDITGFREYTLHVKDLASGRVVDSLPGVWNGLAWAGDSRTIFYLTADAAKRGNAVWRHVVGTPRARDFKVFQDDVVRHEVGVHRSRSDKFVFISSDSFTSSEWRAIPADRPTAAPRVIARRRPGVEYTVDHGGGLFYILTNERARNFRIVRAPDTAGSPRTWKDWVPHRADVFVEGVQVFKRHAVVSERKGGLRRIRVVDLGSGEAHAVRFPEHAYGVYPESNPEFDTRVFRFTYSSFVTPDSVYDYDLARRSRKLLKRREIPSGFDPDRYVVRRLMVAARDRALVPVSLLLRKGTRLDGGSPLLLYGYGSYGVTLEPTFDSDVLSLVDRGMVYAIAHVRGGQEMGRPWYDAGKMLNKKNTFFDFIDVAQDLIRSGYTRTDRIVANGGSAGGLLMGAVANMRPDLFRAIVAEVPFVDVINTMLDETLPLTAQEWEQWGNPKKAAHFAYMRSYSPYDNVARQAYPWLLVTTSLNDSQVMYWEPAKWVAKLRAHKTDTNPLYLRTNMAGGHGGSSGRYDQLRETAFRYAFVLDAVGLAGER